MARTPPMQFTLGRLAISIACFAIAFGVVAFCFKWPHMRPHGFRAINITAVLLWLLAPLLGADVGFGIGILLDKRLKGTMIGVATAVSLDVVAVIVFLLS